MGRPARGASSATIREFAVSFYAENGYWPKVVQAMARYPKTSKATAERGIALAKKPAPAKVTKLASAVKKKPKSRSKRSKKNLEEIALDVIHAIKDDRDPQVIRALQAMMKFAADERDKRLAREGSDVGAVDAKTPVIELMKRYDAVRKGRQTG